MTDNLEKLAKTLKTNLEIKDRKWRTKTYKQCFLHSHAVDYLVQKSKMDEGTAVVTLNELRTLGYVQHVVDPHKEFKMHQKGKLYFCFLDDQASHVRQKQGSNSKKFLKENNVTKEILQYISTTSDDFVALQTKVNRLESSLHKLTENEHATQTKLEIIHQATIALIQLMMATAFLLVILLGYTLFVIVPDLHQSRGIMLATSLTSILSILSFVRQGMNMFSVYLQLDKFVLQAAEGEDAVEDYEMEMMSVSCISSGKTPSHHCHHPMLPRPPKLQIRQSSLRLKESLLLRAKSHPQSALVPTVQQRKAADLPHPSQWPQRPVLVCANTPVDPSLKVPDYGDGPCPIGKPFHFSSDLFEGQCLVRLRNIPHSDDPAQDKTYFSGRRRLFQTIVQGRFKEPLKVSEVLTGHEFVQPLQNLPHPWILKAATNLIGKLAPGADIRVASDQPTMLASLAATSQVVRGDEPGNEPDLSMATNDLEEDCSLLGGKFSSGTVSARGRKLHLASPVRAANYIFDTETVYTFDFYQSLLNCVTYSLDMGVANIRMAPVLNGQPIQSLCKTTDGRYLWSFQIWHECLLPPTSLEDDNKDRKQKTN